MTPWYLHVLQVMYTSQHGEPPRSIIEHMERTHNVKFIDVHKAPGFPSDISMRGFQIKAFSTLLSSFEEVLFLDSDNMPFKDPSWAFELKAYQRTGAMFWPGAHMCYGMIGIACIDLHYA